MELHQNNILKSNASIKVGTTNTYSEMRNVIQANKYYSTAVVYDSLDKVIGIAIVEK